MFNRLLRVAAVAAGALVLLPATVSAQSANATDTAQARTAIATPVVTPVVHHYAALVHASYADTLAAARNLQASVRAFVAGPDAARLESARKAWLEAREWYGQTEAFRFYGGPIDDDNGPEGRINAWPMDESYVDGVEGKPDAGLINNRKFIITKRALAAQNERGGEENIATGWHAIEFLLWGQDTSANGPGNRRARRLRRRQDAQRRPAPPVPRGGHRAAGRRPGRPGQGLGARTSRTTTARASSAAAASRCAGSSSAWARCRAANSPASGSKSRWPARTRKTSTPASPTTRIATS